MQFIVSMGYNPAEAIADATLKMYTVAQDTALQTTSGLEDNIVLAEGEMDKEILGIPVVPLVLSVSAVLALAGVIVARRTRP